MDQTIRAWITKYALTIGIFVIEDAKWRRDISDEMITYRRPGALSESAHGNDWHRTEEAAIARAEQMREAKIESHRKAILKLEKLTFSRLTPPKKRD